MHETVTAKSLPKVVATLSVALALLSCVVGTPVALAQDTPGTPANPPILKTPQDQQPPAVTGSPRIRLTEFEFLWDTVLQGKTFMKDWIVYNDGDQPLKISQVRTKCVCSTFDYDQEIAPGDSGIVRLIFDSNKIKVGTTKKTATIYSNDPKYPEVTVWYGGPIVLAFRHRPSTVQLRGLVSDQTTVPVTVSPATPQKFEIIETSVAYDQFEVSEISPAPDQPGSFVLQLRKKAVAKAEIKPDFVKLKLQMEDGDVIEPYIRVKVVHQDSVVITPSPTKTLLFMNRETNRLLDEGAKPVEKRLTVSGANSQIKLKVLDARIEVPEKVPAGVFSVRVEEARPDERYNVVVAIHEYPSITYTDGKVFIDVEQGGQVTTHEIKIRAMFAGRRR
ncbi:MAG: DUF1573 domain-containing protein [Planctomycetota bacterium]